MDDKEARIMTKKRRKLDDWRGRQLLNIEKSQVILETERKVLNGQRAKKNT